MPLKSTNYRIEYRDIPSTNWSKCKVNNIDTLEKARVKLLRLKSNKNSPYQYRLIRTRVYIYEEEI